MSASLVDCQDSSVPLVSIGIPTYNRAVSLKSAIESALIQDYPNLELVISDNASTDETETLCKQLCEQDKRVRYIRQPLNRGATANFIEVLKHSQGTFFMWLSDDDSLEHFYISQCVKVLVDRPEHSLVCGKAIYYENNKIVNEGLKVNLIQDKGEDRVLAYYVHVLDNGTFYGLMRREELANIPCQNTLGGDWLLVAAMAFIGKVKTLENVAINRACGGTSKNLTNIAESLGLSKFQAANPYLAIAISVFKDIAWILPVYGAMNKLSRWLLAYRAFIIIVFRFGVPAWYYTLRGKIALRTRIKQIVANPSKLY